MLNFLQIDNYALIRHAEVEFESGFNCITGESGAGKSILLGALGFLTGARGGGNLIRTGAARCEVSALFTVPESLRDALAGLLEPAGIAFDRASGELALRRVLTPSGSRQFINDSPVTSKLCADTGALLIDRQKVNEQLSLQHPARQLELLDRWAGTVGLREQCARLCGELAEERKRKEAFSAALPSPAEADRLKLMLDEIAAVNPEEHEDDTLSERFRMGSNAREIIGEAEALVQLLSESENSVADLLGAACRKLVELKRLGADCEALASDCAVIQENVEHLARELSSLAGKVELDPEELAAIEARMGAIFTLKRRYGPSLEELFAHRDQAKEELRRFDEAAAALADFDRKIAAGEKELRRCCKELSARRRSSVKGFLAQVTEKLRKLGFGKCRFEAAFEEILPGPAGSDKIELLFSANAGVEVQPLRKIASSGELSRLMLGLKTVLADADDVPTVIFDEIDMNIGGETANAVGEELCRLGKSRQIISISHLAQVAARADHHFKVEKSAGEKAAVSSVRKLADPEEEIARMLGNSKAAAEHARKLLKELGRK